MTIIELTRNKDFTTSLHPVEPFIFVGEIGYYVLRDSWGESCDDLFTVGTISKTKVDSVSGLTWNGAYHGWYDVSDNYYERLWFIGHDYYDAYPIPGNSVSLGITLPYPTHVLNANKAVAYVKSSIEGTVGISDPLPYISPAHYFTYTVEKFNGSTYDTIHTRTETSSSGQTTIYVQYGEKYRFTMTRNSGLNLYIRYLGFIGSDPNALRL